MTAHGRADEELKRGTLLRGSEMNTVNGHHGNMFTEKRPSLAHRSPHTHVKIQYA